MFAPPHLFYHPRRRGKFAAGKRAHLKAARFTIGRTAGNIIPIDDPSVSTKHFVLIRDGDSCSIEIDASRLPREVKP